MTTRPEAAPRPGGKRAGAGRKVPPPVESKENQEVRPKNQASDTKDEKSYGETSEYLAARIARDAPAVHEEMKAGKYPSVRAAAKAAGVVKVRAVLKAIHGDAVRLTMDTVEPVRSMDRLAASAGVSPTTVQT